MRRIHVSSQLPASHRGVLERIVGTAALVVARLLALRQRKKGPAASSAHH